MPWGRIAYAPTAYAPYIYAGENLKSFADIESMPEYNATYHSQARYYLEFK